MNNVETNVVEEANVNEANDVIVCDYNKLGFTDGVKLIGRSIKNNAKKIAIGAGVVTAVGVGALVAHALKKHDDDSNDAIVDSTAREVNVYDPEEETKRYGVYQSDEELNAAVCQMYNDEEAVNSQETTEE